MESVIERNGELFTVREAASLAHVSPRTIARMCELGEVRAVKVRSMWRINRADLMRVLGLN